MIASLSINPDTTQSPAALNSGVEGFECLGEGLNPKAEEHLRLAGLHYHDDSLALQHLEQAEALAPGHAAVLISRYRFFFYKNRLKDALEVGRECLKKSARDIGCGEDWQSVQPDDASFGQFEAILPRFFLFTLKGYAYLSLRLGDLEQGRGAIGKLLELDPSDKVGARVLLDVLDRQGRNDEYEYGD